MAPGELVDLKWKAKITRDQTGAYPGCQSLECAMIDDAGKVEFRETLNRAGTKLHIAIDYFPPVGIAGRGTLPYSTTCLSA